MLDLPGYVSLEVHEELRGQLATAEQERDAAQSRRMGLQELVAQIQSMRLCTQCAMAQSFMAGGGEDGGVA
jgi:hypothetical protein